MAQPNAGQTLFQGLQGFHWFTGVVRQVDNDEQKLFRVRVAVIGLHDYNETDLRRLTLAQPLIPIGSVQGAGDTPTLYVGARVVGFFPNESTNFGYILGAYPVTTENENTHTIHWNAREKNIIDKPKEYTKEFESAYKAKYPFNRVISTRPDANGRAHVIEIDDTPGEERLHVYHKAGTYIEINKDGRVVIKCVGDSYELVNGNKELYVKGTYKIKAEGNIEIASSKGNVRVAAADSPTGGEIALWSGKKMLINGGDGITFTGSTEMAVKLPGGINVTDSGIKAWGTITSMTETANFTTDGADITLSFFGPAVEY